MKGKIPSLSLSFFWSVLGTGGPLVLGLLTVPALLGGLGMERFGILTLVWTAIGYFGLFDFGLGRALTQRVASRLAKVGVLRWWDVANGIYWMLGFGVLGSVVMGVVVFLYTRYGISLSALLRDDALAAGLWAAVSIPLVTLSSGMRGILEGQQDFGKAAALRGLLGVMNFGLPWLLVYVGHVDLVAMVQSLVLARLLVLLLSVWWLKGIWFGRGEGEKRGDGETKELFQFGMWMTVSNVVGPFMVAADRFILAGLLGAQLVAYYTVPQDAVLRLLVLPAAWATVWFPRFAGLWNSASAEALREQLLRGVKVVMWGMGILCLALVIFAKPLLVFWLGIEFAKAAAALTQVLLVGVFFNSMAHIPLAALQASGRVALTAKLHVVELLLYMPLLLWAVHSQGLMGAAWVWMARTVIDFVFLFGFSLHRHDSSSVSDQG